MSTLSDKLKAAQGGGTNAPQLNVSAYIDMGQIEGKAAFKMYDKENKKQLYSTKPITGVFIGHGMTMEAFDKDMGANGGSWKTSVYFAKTDKLFLFEPGKDKSAFGGTFDKVLAQLTKRGLQPKKKYSVYILTEKGLICIKTNVTLGISDSNVCKDGLADHMVSLIPTIYSATDTSIPKKTHGYLGKIAATNPPNYAKMVLSEAFDEARVMSWGILEVIEEFTAWREYKQKTGKVTQGETGAKDESIASPELPMNPPLTVAQQYQQNTPPSPNPNEVDDLPF